MNVDQSQFRDAIMSPDAPRPDGLSDGQGQPAGRRFDVYRNNVAVSLTEALETAFPVIRKLVGDGNFRLLAAAFLRQHPPTSPLMMFYGKEMPAFLSSFEPTKALGYLPDIARLELALRESYHAADHISIDRDTLGAASPDMLMKSTVRLAPSLRLIRSAWPIHAIWRFNMDNGPKPAAIVEDVAVLRAELDPEPVLLPRGGGAFLASLLANETLGTAFEVATAESSTFDLSQLLALLIGANAITTIGETK